MKEVVSSLGGGGGFNLFRVDGFCAGRTQGSAERNPGRSDAIPLGLVLEAGTPVWGLRCQFTKSVGGTPTVAGETPALPVKNGKSENHFTSSTLELFIL
jgi:hypothetical protein